jgi:hypothetical protein
LGTFTDPVFRAFEVQLDVIPLFERMIRANFFDKLAIARAAAVRDHNPKDRTVFCPDTFHANSNSHNESMLDQRFIAALPFGKPLI